jgi:hypothetical protein
MGGTSHLDADLISAGFWQNYGSARRQKLRESNPGLRKKGLVIPRKAIERQVDIAAGCRLNAGHLAAAATAFVAASPHDLDVGLRTGKAALPTLRPSIFKGAQVQSNP